MSSFRLLLLWFCLYFFPLICQQYTGDGESWWQSTEDIQTLPAQGLGTIKIGREMYMEFDFQWHGRSNYTAWEPFFRVGASGTISKGCTGQNSRYPSMWLQETDDQLHFSIAEIDGCTAGWNLGPTLNTYNIYHITIWFNQDRVIITINDILQLDGTRTGTSANFLGDNATIWFSSDWFSDRYIAANATFSNVYINSTGFPTPAPTNNPSIQPTNVPTTSMPTTYSPSIPSLQPTYTPTYIPTETPSNAPTTFIRITPEPTYSPSVSTLTPSNTPTQTPVAIEDEDTHDTETSLIMGLDSMIFFIIISVLSCIVCVLFICIIIYCRHKDSDHIPSSPKMHHIRTASNQNNYKNNLNAGIELNTHDDDDNKANDYLSAAQREELKVLKKTPGRPDNTVKVTKNDNINEDEFVIEGSQTQTGSFSDEDVITSDDDIIKEMQTPKDDGGLLNNNINDDFRFNIKNAAGAGVNNVIHDMQTAGVDDGNINDVNDYLSDAQVKQQNKTKGGAADDYDDMYDDDYNEPIKRADTPLTPDQAVQSGSYNNNDNMNIVNFDDQYIIEGDGAGLGGHNETIGDIDNDDDNQFNGDDVVDDLESFSDLETMK